MQKLSGKSTDFRKMLVNAGVFVFLVTCCYGRSIHEDIIKINQAFDKGIEFVVKNRNQINLDGYFGLNLAAAHLTPFENSPVSDFVSGKLKILRQLLVYANETIPVQGELLTFMKPFFLVPKNWVNNARFTQGRLRGKAAGIIPKRVNTSQEYAYYAMESRYNFDEPFSDYCLAWAMRPIYGNGTCKLPPECDIQIDDENISPAYNISHRLLLLQVAKASNCKWNSEFVEGKIEKFCDFMLWEANFMQPLQLTNSGFADLFLEQIVLCGHEGFEEFMHPDWIDYVLAIQDDSGCFTKHFDESGHTRVKRMSNKIYGDCHDHTTGLGIDVLALFLKYLLGKQLQEN